MSVPALIRGTRWHGGPPHAAGDRRPGVSTARRRRQHTDVDTLDSPPDPRRIDRWRCRRRSNRSRARCPITIVALDGELDATSYERVIDDGPRRSTTPAVADLLIDLTDLAFISSSGLVAMHSSLRLMRGEAPPEPESRAGRRFARDRRMRSISDAESSRTSDCAARRTRIQKVLDRTGLGGLDPVVPGSRDGASRRSDGPATGATRMETQRRRSIRLRLERILAPWAADPERAGRRPSSDPAGATIAGRAVESDDEASRGGAIREAMIVVDGSLVAASRRDRRSRSRHQASGRAIDALAVAIGELVAETRARTAAERALRAQWRRPTAATALGIDAGRAGQGAAAAAQHRLARRRPTLAGYDLASHYAAAGEIGGDFFELFRLRRRGHPLGIVIADVTGKGLDAALLMAFSRPVMHSALNAIARTGRCPRADESRARRRASRHALHHRCLRAAASPGQAACASPARARAAAAGPGRRQADHGGRRAGGADRRVREDRRRTKPS